MKPAGLVEKLNGWRVLLEGLQPTSSEARLRIDTVLREMHQAWIESIREVEADRVTQEATRLGIRPGGHTGRPHNLNGALRELEPTTFEAKR